MLKQRAGRAAIGGIGMVALGVALTGCGGGGGSNIINSTPQTAFGSSVAFGAGTLRSFITSNNGVPVEIGVEVSKAALANPARLPVPAPGNQLGDAVEIRMPSPAQLSTLTPFVATDLFYSPKHAPASQEVPHLHPSWFLITDPVRFSILPGRPGVNVTPAAAELPSGFITPPDPTLNFVPTLGNVYFSPQEPGFLENPIKTPTSQYFYFNGHLDLEALTVPNSALLSQRALQQPLGIPTKYPKPGYYPTTYSVRYDAIRQVSIMALGNFVLRS